MTNFQPNSIIYLGNVPFDNSYRHTMTFASKAAQAAYFSSVCTQSLSRNDYTYVRMNNAIRVPFNAERLYTYDYCMYKNANYGDKWFYAFITAVNYVNENMTELVLELDVMQTWYFDYTLTQGFVEREHVNDDTIGLHINAEPAMDLQYIKDSYTPHIAKPYYAVFLVTAFPKYTASQEISTRYGMPAPGDMKVNGSTPVSGGIYQNQLSGCAFLIYDLTDETSIKTMYRDMQAFNEAGAGNAIVDAFTLPAYAFNEEDLILKQFSTGRYDKRWTLINEATLETQTILGTFPTSLNGYIPRNNKLLCYPYCYLELGDFTGRKQDYRFEFFASRNTEGGRWQLDEIQVGSADGAGFVTPLNYNGVSSWNSTIGQSIDPEPFYYQFTNKIPWVFSAYQNWAAQNQVANQLAVVGSLASIGAATIPGIGAASSALGRGLSIASGLSEIQGGQYLAAQERTYAHSQAAKEFSKNANAYGMAAGAGGLGTVIANYERMKRVPNEARGNTSGNARMQANYTGWYDSEIALRYEFAEIVDGFFDMYGYQVDKVKIPNRTGRTSWNYVKMQNSCHRGNVPASDMDKINAIYDAGITFWHTSDVGNYSLSNVIVP